MFTYNGNTVHGTQNPYSREKTIAMSTRSPLLPIVHALADLATLRTVGAVGPAPLGLSPLYRVLGLVEAGFPSPAEEELRDTLSLDEFLVNNPDASFLLKVSGDSMTGAGILPGDLVIVDRGMTAKSGDIVIAEVDGEWTMKFLKKSGDAVYLMPANPRYKPIRPQRELTITGVVTAVVRKYRQGQGAGGKGSGYRAGETRDNK
jgi:SOS regulatory protein LexA